MDDTLPKRVKRLIEEAERYSEDQKHERDKALEYYAGQTPDLPAEEGMSSAVSTDVRAIVKKVMPSIMRTIMANDVIGEYEPVSPESDEQAEQASDFINHVVVPECGAIRAIYDAIWDAVVLKTGILKWTAYERTKVVISRHSGQGEEALLGLDELGEIGDVKASEDGFISFTLKRNVTKVDIRLESVPRGAFLIHPNASSIEDSPIVGERLSLTRSELVSQGYDKDVVWDLRSDSEPRDPDSTERRDKDDTDEHQADLAREMEAVRVWDCYVQLDRDGDGVAETHHIVMAEGKTANNRNVILRDEPAPEVPYAEVVAERDAHQFEGHSIAEDIIPIQRVKTSVLRNTLDNIYWQNNPQPYVQLDAIMDTDALYHPMPRKPVLLKSGFAAEQAISWRPVPFMAENSFNMLDYWDREAKERTGITDASGGVDPDALENTTATASMLMNETGVAQTELMMRSLTQGIKKAFEGLLRLVVAHADKPRTIRLRGEWHEYDPRSWDAEMQFTVNIGLGAGTRERDLTVLQMILGLQNAIVTQTGPMNPLVKPEQLYNTLAKIAETAGFPSADPYFTQPDPEEIQRMVEASQNQPNEAEMKAQAQMQIEQAKGEARAQVEQAQMQADLVVKEAEIEAERLRAQDKLQADATIAQLNARIEMLMHKDKMALEYAKMDQQAETARMTAEQAERQHYQERNGFNG